MKRCSLSIVRVVKFLDTNSNIYISDYSKPQEHFYSRTREEDYSKVKFVEIHFNYLACITIHRTRDTVIRHVRHIDTLWFMNSSMNYSEHHKINCGTFTNIIVETVCNNASLRQFW